METTAPATNSIQMSTGISASQDIENQATVASSSPNNPDLNFGLLLDLLYYEAAVGNANKFESHSQYLDQILTPNGNTILHIHITARQPKRRNQDRDFIQRILELCPQLLWKTNKTGETLLHMAARHGHDDVVKFLLNECRNGNRNQDQQQGDSSAIRRMLLMVNEAKDTALHEAVRYNRLDVVKLLIEENRNLPYSFNSVGETPLYLAAERGYEKVLNQILATCILPADQGPYGRTALHAAIICYCFPNRGIISSLLEDKRIQKDKKDEEGWTALHFAAHLGHLHIVKLIIGKDKSVAYKANNSGKTALHIAASLGKVDIMKVLISNCPGSCELVDNRGWNVLHFAYTSRNRKAVGIILENPSLGNLVNEKDHQGNTPFLLAASERFIITHPKVDMFVFNHDNHSAAHITKVLPCCTWASIKDLAQCRPSVTYTKLRNYRRVFLEKDEDKGEKSIDKLNAEGRNDLLVATLIATVTFAAGIAVPGGFISDKGPDQGSAILTRKAAFRAFIILNGLSLVSSSLVVYDHMDRRGTFKRINILRRVLLYRSLLITFAMFAMIGAFFSATYAILHSDSHLAAVACAVIAAALISFTDACLWVRMFIRVKDYIRMESSRST